MINCCSGPYSCQIFCFPSYYSYAANDVYEDQEAGWRLMCFISVRFSWVLVISCFCNRCILRSAHTLKISIVCLSGAALSPGEIPLFSVEARITPLAFCRNCM